MWPRGLRIRVRRERISRQRRRMPIPQSREEIASMPPTGAGAGSLRIPIQPDGGKTMEQRQPCGRLWLQLTPADEAKKVTAVGRENDHHKRHKSRKGNAASVA